MPADQTYVLHFEWPQGRIEGVSHAQTLDADTEERARMEAAVLYAGAGFKDPAPLAYRIVGPSGVVIYRYPEPEQAWR